MINDPPLQVSLTTGEVLLVPTDIDEVRHLVADAAAFYRNRNRFYFTTFSDENRVIVAESILSILGEHDDD